MRSLLGYGLLLCAQLGALAALRSGQPVVGQTAALPSQHLLTVSVGDYLQGWLDGGEQPLQLQLLDADGQVQRQLLRAASGRNSWRFVAERPGLRLAVSGTRAGLPYQLGLEQQLSRAEQHAPPDMPLSPRLAALAQALERGDSSQAFWQAIAEQGTPLVEPTDAGEYLLTFLWRGAERNVRLFGGPTADHVNLSRLGQSDVWFHSFKVPATTRLSYQLAPDVPDLPDNERARRVAILATAQADPLNRQPWPADAPDRFNRQSVVELPQAPPQPGMQGGGYPAGSLSEFSLHSARLGNRRSITLYRPAGFQPKRADNLLLFVFDAEEYLSKVPTPQLLDNLIGAGHLPPVLAVFVANPDREARSRELPDNPEFAAFMAKELLPRIAAETGLQPQAARTVLAGSSYGGLAAASVAIREPQAFGNVLSLSGSFWWSPPATPPERSEHIASELAGQPRLPLRFFLAAGLFETGRAGSAGILETNRHLRDVLQAKHYPHVYREYAAGHDYLAWRGSLADGLLALFGTAQHAKQGQP